MLIVLDFDETFTRDPFLWHDFITLAKQRGHTIICATMRHESEGEDVIRFLGDRVEKIIFTDRKAKRKAVYDAGYMPSVWIDDSPQFIDNDALPRVQIKEGLYDN